MGFAILDGRDLSQRRGDAMPTNLPERRPVVKTDAASDPFFVGGVIFSAILATLVLVLASDRIGTLTDSIVRAQMTLEQIAW
jgi:hypothetical protein